jgi:hypothetical protein
MATGRQFDLPYMVDQWDGTDTPVEELIALTGDYRVARAAFPATRPPAATKTPSATPVDGTST